MVSGDGLPAPLERPMQTFSDRSVEVLREMVLSCRLRAGERLNETKLAKALGISRGPLREAIQQLRSEGLVSSVSHRGAYVRTFTTGGLRDIYEVRIALETHAVRLAVRACDRDEVDSLHSLLDQTGEVLTSEESRAYPCDLDFHASIVALANNQALLDSATEVHRQVHLARSRSAREPRRAKEALAEHEVILEELSRGRTRTAVKALTRHLHASLDNALRVLEAAVPDVSRDEMLGQAGSGQVHPDSRPDGIVT